MLKTEHSAWIARYFSVLFAYTLSLPAVAYAGCELAEPKFRENAGTMSVEVMLNCSNTERVNDLIYPNGVLHVGMSLVELPSEQGTVSIQLNGSEPKEHLVAPAQIDFGAGERSATLELGAVPAGATHYVVALWSEESECVDLPAMVCFGPVDDDLFPIPLDTYPRPVCDRDELSAKGYFDWALHGDPSGYQSDQTIKDLFYSVDCYRGNQSEYGLGVSLKRWRVAPLPNRWR